MAKRKASETTLPFRRNRPRLTPALTASSVSSRDRASTPPRDQLRQSCKDKSKGQTPVAPPSPRTPPPKEKARPTHPLRIRTTNTLDLHERATELRTPNTYGYDTLPLAELVEIIETKWEKPISEILYVEARGTWPAIDLRPRFPAPPAATLEQHYKTASRIARAKALYAEQGWAWNETELELKNPLDWGTSLLAHLALLADWTPGFDMHEDVLEVLNWWVEKRVGKGGERVLTVKDVRETIFGICRVSKEEEAKEELVEKKLPKKVLTEEETTEQEEIEEDQEEVVLPSRRQNCQLRRQFERRIEEEDEEAEDEDEEVKMEPDENEEAETEIDIDDEEMQDYEGKPESDEIDDVDDDPMDEDWEE